MGIFLDLSSGHGHQPIPVFFGEEVAHFLGSARIQPLANDQERLVLVVRGSAVDRCCCRFDQQQRTGVLTLGGANRPGGWFERGGQFSQRSDVGRGGAAAATDHLHAQVLDEVHQLHLQLNRRESVVGHTADVLGQPRIGNATHHKGTVGTQIADVLLHLLGPGGAVQSEHVDREGLQNRNHRRDVGAHQHRAGGFHRDAHHQGAPLAG